MRSKDEFKLAVLLALALTTASVSQSGCGGSSNTARNYHYTVPEKTDDGWETADMRSENLDTELINDLFKQIINNAYTNIHSVLIVKNGKLIIEEYFAGAGADGLYHEYKRDTLHYQASVTKSVTSILLGIAIDRHLLSSVNEKVSFFFPEYSDIFADNAKARIRLRDFLSMSAGLKWNEWKYPYTDSRNDHIVMNNSPDPVRFMLERPAVKPPGKEFVYNGGLSIALGEIIYKVSGLRADKFAERYLFEPLGITDYIWQKYPNGTVQTGGGLIMKPRDMAKIGYLYLNGGRWEGKQIVSEEWVRQSTKQQAPDRDYGYPWWAPTFLRHLTYDPPTDHNEYGYQWWVNSFRAEGRNVDAYSAQGRGGQFIFVFPEFRMVAVFTGWNDNSSWDQPFYIVERYILPAVITR